MGPEVVQESCSASSAGDGSEGGNEIVGRIGVDSGDVREWVGYDAD